MKASRRTVARVIVDGLSGGKRLSPTAIAAYLLQTHRASDIASLLRDIRVERARRGQVEVIADTAYPLTSETRSSIEQQTRDLYPAAKRVSITERSDPELLSGVSLDMVDYQLDLSARRALQRFTAQALAGKDV